LKQRVVLQATNDQARTLARPPTRRGDLDVLRALVVVGLAFTSGMHARVAAVRRFLGEAPRMVEQQIRSHGRRRLVLALPKPARELTP
jgi:hypothetical protein